MTRPIEGLSVRQPGVLASYPVDLVASTASPNGVVEMQYRRHR